VHHGKIIGIDALSGKVQRRTGPGGALSIAAESTAYQFNLAIHGGCHAMNGTNKSTLASPNHTHSDFRHSTTPGIADATKDRIIYCCVLAVANHPPIGGTNLGENPL
jgi:hypothetical protein